jgi:hypothetical protein
MAMALLDWYLRQITVTLTCYSKTPRGFSTDRIDIPSLIRASLS